jgi:hypothetical protein
MLLEFRKVVAKVSCLTVTSHLTTGVNTGLVSHLY